MKYPDYVREYRPKGTIVKKSGDTYYAYYAVSKRVPDKKYPVQRIQGLAGKIDETGFHPMTGSPADTRQVRVWESGFTNYLLNFENAFVNAVPAGTAADRRALLRGILVLLSPASYLSDREGETSASAEALAGQLGLDLNAQISLLSALCGHDLEDLAPLKTICSVQMGGRMFLSELTGPQREALERLGLTEEDIR